jgi:hypothetical protein
VLALVRLALALAIIGSASTAASQPGFVRSPYLETIPDPGGCDVHVTPSNAVATLPRVNEPGVRVFCIAPGDYRSFGPIRLTSSGRASARRYLRFDAPHGDQTTAVQRSFRARFESILVRGDWWVLQGLTIQPVDRATSSFVWIDAGDNNVIDGCLVDGSSHPNVNGQRGIVIEAEAGDPATDNVVQRNVVSNGNRSRLSVDYFGILIRDGVLAGEHNDRNRILDNEVYDWGDAVALGSSDPTCGGRMQRGNVIDGNDLYVTPAKYVDCATGAPDRTGQCACAENAIDIKSSATPLAADWTIVTNNRAWGHRPTAGSCGGSGANGPAISAGNSCAGNVVVSRNAVSDATIGILPAGENWIVTGNLLHDIRTSVRYGSAAISTPPSATNLSIEFNTIVDVDSSYDPQSYDTDTRCNAIIDNEQLIEVAATGRPADHFTRYNHLYDSPPWHFLSSSNLKFATAGASNNATLCYWRKRWTNPEQVCVPYASTTARSPHVASFAACHPDLLEPFGLGRVTWPTATPCADGVDNDGDGRRDANDVACAAGALREDPLCQNGIDDDGDGTLDFDGGRATNGGSALGPADPSCTEAGLEGEGGIACGLGFEAGVALTLAGWLRRRQRRARG